MKIEDIDKVLLNYVGDNVGQGCECEACKRNRKIVKEKMKKWFLEMVGEDENEWNYSDDKKDGKLKDMLFGVNAEKKRLRERIK